MLTVYIREGHAAGGEHCMYYEEDRVPFDEPDQKVDENNKDTKENKENKENIV
ncbi:hypothetical protein GCM10010911_30440 [Paenibacillus nasutitermitis]|uniref:Uncharacterized protein n=1 Tax=Paenibacillus nasutitermitis TaxID=1652958 RepID=A0A916Z0R5_9BACL|nr:hypothetical protein GCM10010911_30440 [Paenibacillus nasutitermitis]